MKEIRNKIVATLYILLASTLFIGWYPLGQAELEGLYPAASQVGTAVETMCLLEENEQLFWQGVAETPEEARRENEQMDEERRRLSTEIAKKKKAKKKAKKEKEKAASVGAVSRRILERIVEAEAGDQDMKGRILVANVVMNRVKSKEFPDSVRGVVFARRQFSPVSNGRYYSVTVSGVSKRAVQRALQGEDHSSGALYFMCRRASSPSNVAWFDRDLTRLFAHGDHEFFR